jgi:hypothetical protein
MALFFSTIFFGKNCLTKMPLTPIFNFFGLIRAYPWRYFREWRYFRVFTVYDTKYQFFMRIPVYVARICLSVNGRYWLKDVVCFEADDVAGACIGSCNGW